MHVIGNIAYAIVSDEKRGKLDTKGSKCMLLIYFIDMKVYRLMCLEIKIHTK